MYNNRCFPANTFKCEGFFCYDNITITNDATALLLVSGEVSFTYD